MSRPSENADAILVNPEVLSTAIKAAARETSVEKFTFIETEPWLSSYCRTELFQILGKLAVAGATPAVVRGVAVDIHQLVAVTAKAMRTGYCTLLEDFLPEFSVTAPEPRTQTTEGDDASPPAQTRRVKMKTWNSAQGDAMNNPGNHSAANRRRAKLERLRGVLGLNAAGMTYQQIGGYIGVGSRQRVQQLVVEAVERLPQLARSLGVTGRRHPGRRPKKDHEAEVQRVGNTREPGAPRASVRARHMATARKLLNQHGGRYTPTGLRNRALIALLYRTGLRINEALSLYPKDLELADGSVRVLNGKGGRSRTVGLDPGAAAVVERWLDARSRINLDPTARSHVSPGGRCPVFCTLRGRARAAAYIRVLLKRLAARAGIDKRVHAHGLRHTHAAQLRAEGVDIAIISRQLGHVSITTTACYLDHLAPTAVIEAMRRRTWAGS